MKILLILLLSTYAFAINPPTTWTAGGFRDSLYDSSLNAGGTVKATAGKGKLIIGVPDSAIDADKLDNQHGTYYDTVGHGALATLDTTGHGAINTAINGKLGLHAKADSAGEADSLAHHAASYFQTALINPVVAPGGLTNYYLPVVTHASATTWPDTVGNSLIQQDASATAVIIGDNLNTRKFNVRYNPGGTAAAGMDFGHSGTGGATLGILATATGHGWGGGKIVFYDDVNYNALQVLDCNNGNIWIGGTSAATAPVLYVNGNGQVSIGGAPASTHAFDIYKTGTAVYMAVGDLSSTGPLFYIGSNGTNAYLMSRNNQPLAFGANGTSTQLIIGTSGQLTASYYSTAGVLQNAVTTGLISSHACGAGALQKGSGGQLADANLTESGNVLTATDSLFLNGYGFKTTKSITGDTGTFTHGLKASGFWGALYGLADSATMADSCRGGAVRLGGHTANYFQTALTNPVTGTGTNSYIAAWNGTNQIQTAAPYVNGPWYIAGKVIDTGSLQVTDSINITPTGYANPFSIHEGATYYLQYIIGSPDDDYGLLTNRGSFENADWIRTDSIATRAANITSMSAGQIPYMGSTGLAASLLSQSAGVITVNQAAGSHAQLEALTATTNKGAFIWSQSDASQLYLSAYGSAYGSTACGLSRKGLANLEAISTVGLLLDVSTDLPLVFGTNNVERARINATGLGIGNTAPGNTLTLGTSGGTASFGIADVQTVTMTGDQNLTPTCTRIELNGTHNATLLAGSLPNGTLLIITHGGTGYPTVTFNGHNYTIDANHSFLFFKNSAGNWYPLTPYTS